MWKKKKHNERIIKEQEEDYYEPKRVSNVSNNNELNMRVMVIKIEIYH